MHNSLVAYAIFDKWRPFIDEARSGRSDVCLRAERP